MICDEKIKYLVNSTKEISKYGSVIWLQYYIQGVGKKDFEIMRALNLYNYFDDNGCVILTFFFC